MKIEVGLTSISDVGPDGTPEVREGEFTMVIEIPDDLSLEETITTLIVAIQHHSGKPDRPPAWIDCSSAALSNAVAQHYQLVTRTRPTIWGQEGKTA